MACTFVRAALSPLTSRWSDRQHKGRFVAAAAAFPYASVLFELRQVSCQRSELLGSRRITLDANKTKDMAKLRSVSSTLYCTTVVYPPMPDARAL